MPALCTGTLKLNVAVVSGSDIPYHSNLFKIEFLIEPAGSMYFYLYDFTGCRVATW